MVIDATNTLLSMAINVKGHSDAKHKYTEDDIIGMLNFLIDNLFVEFDG